MLENPAVLVLISGVASLRDPIVLRNPGFSWPAQFHDERYNSTIIVATGPAPAEVFCSNHASPAANETAGDGWCCQVEDQSHHSTLSVSFKPSNMSLFRRGLSKKGEGEIRFA